MGKKRNIQGLHLPNVQAHREKLKLNYRARGRPRLPKYMLEDLTDASVHDESSSEGNWNKFPFCVESYHFWKKFGVRPSKRLTLDCGSALPF